VQAAIRRQALMASSVAAFVLLVGALVSVFVAKSFSHPIIQLTEMTASIAAGDLTRKIDIPSTNEIGGLAASFNEMTRQLKESIDNLKETTAAKERIESELEIAHDIQMSMVPKIFPPFPNRSEFDIYATLVPAREVGGDLYDFFFIDEDRLCFAIGDVSGKGVPASLFMAVTRTLLKATAGKVDSPDGILSRLNKEICDGNESCMFVTIFCGILDIRTGQVEYSNGGHNLPYFLCPEGIKPLENTGGMALGLTENAVYRSERMVLRAGEGLFLYTDGVTEAMDENENLFSEHRLEEFLGRVGGSSVAEIIRRAVGEVKDFSAGVLQSDDITILALRYLRGNDNNGEMTGETISVELKNRLAEIERLSQIIDAFGKRHHLTSQVLFNLSLALEEILTNVISYGYADSDEHRIIVRLSLKQGELTAEVEDDGRPFNPLEAPEPDVERSLGERPIGGLGIHLVRKSMDRLEYRREEGKNLLVMKKRAKEA
jgi:sigma-B regulation protein RsbU (phosphoserine phosphatase)